jgi:DNA-binding transcriptional ArsR family regulator
MPAGKIDLLSDAAAGAAAASLALLADSTRLKIFWTLMQGEQHVNALAELVGAKAPAVSQHLSRLKAAGMVDVRREGTFAYYRTCDEHISRIVTDLLDHTAEELAAKAELDARRARRPASPSGGVRRG